MTEYSIQNPTKFNTYIVNQPWSLLHGYVGFITEEFTIYRRLQDASPAIKFYKEDDPRKRRSLVVFSGNLIPTRRFKISLETITSAVFYTY